MNIFNELNESIMKCDAYNNNKYYPKKLLYPFTTENISGYINYFDLNNKSLLTVGSSGDQVINAILYGCKDITLYDIVSNSKYYYYLKCAGLISLTKNEFLEFFRYRDYDGWKKNSNVFNFNIYNNKIKKVLRLLDYESYLYFDELFNTYSNITIREALFEYDEDNTIILERSNLYLKNDIIYNQIKDKIKEVKPKFICKNIFDIDNNKKYDNIWLSNIAQWLNSENEILDMVNKVYFNSLKQNGKMLVSYLYRTSKNSNFKYNSNNPIIYNLKNLFIILKDYYISLKEFDGIDKDNWKEEMQKDSILLLKK